MKKCLCPMGGGILLFNLVFRRSSDAITASSHTFPLPLRRQAAFFRWRQSRTFYKTQWLGHSAQTPTAGFSYIRPLRHPPEPHPSFYFRSHSANFPEANGCRSIPRIPPWLPLSPHPQAMQCGLWSISRIYPLPFFSSNSFRYIASALEKFVHLSSISGGKMLRKAAFQLSV